MKTSLGLAIAAVVVISLAWGQKVLAQAPAAGSWNQLCESFDGARVDFARVNSRVKQLGSEGWELAAMSTAGYNSGAALFVCFKRPGK